MDKFRELNISEDIIKVLQKKGFEEPTEIQKLTIPLVLENKMDIIAQAQTGTGKTASFAIPLIQNLKDTKTPGAIIIAPTRELVIQVAEEFNSLRGDNKLVVAPIYGGQSIDIQLKRLKRGVSVVIGTPGRVLDHIKRGTLKLDKVKYFILDEADEMLNMGFIEDIETILDKTPKERRVLLFSATMPNRIKSLAERYMKDYTHLKTKTNLTTDLTEQIYFEVLERDKFEALSRIIDIELNFYGIIFCRTRRDVDDVTMKLQNRGYIVDGLHGEVSQAQREKILNKFRIKHISILVATDVAARGLDVNNLTHVINYSIPQNPEAYVHRIGRTGRAGQKGIAITFITPREFRQLSFIKKVAKVDIKHHEVPKVKDIIKSKKTNIIKEVTSVLQDDLSEYINLSQKLMEEDSPENVVAALLKYSFEKVLSEKNYNNLTDLKKSSGKQRNRGKGKDKGRPRKISEGKTRLFIAKGSRNKFDKNKLIDLISTKSGVSKSVISQVDVFDSYSFVSVPFVEAEKIVHAFKKERVGKRPIVEKAKK